MAEDSSFLDLLCRVRKGDETAAAELVRRYEPEIRREIRLRLVDQRLRRVFDSVDICQSVLASFFVRVAAGQYDLERPDQLLRLLLGMARNKLAFAARTQQAQRRDHRRLANNGGECVERVADGPSPSRIVAGRELLDAFRKRLSDEERRVADLRGEGFGWSEVAEAMGGTAEGRRKQFARAVERVTRQLGLDERA